jgi:hypothetical protein
MNRNGTAVLVLLVGLAFVAGRLTGGSAMVAASSGQETGAPPLDQALQALMRQGTPGPHHRQLDQLVGEWAAEYTLRTGPDASPVVTHATIRRAWVLDGRFVQETVRAEGPQGSFDGLGYIGFDNFDGQYESVWLDSLSTAMSIEAGTLHPDGKVMHSRGEQRDPVTGRLINAWSKLDMSDPDRHELIGYATDPAGHTFRAVEAVFERVQ